MTRFGEAKELVGATIWLASERASSFVTGAIIRVDGGSDEADEILMMLPPAPCSIMVLANT